MAFLGDFYTFSYQTLAFDRCIEPLTKKAEEIFVTQGNFLTVNILGEKIEISRRRF